MTDNDALDRYFTQQMVGEMLRVDMGPSGRRPVAPPHGVQLNLSGGKARLLGQAARSLLSNDPLQALAGRPFSLPALVEARRGLNLLAWGAMALLLLAGWSAVLLLLVAPWLQR